MNVPQICRSRADHQPRLMALFPREASTLTSTTQSKHFICVSTTIFGLSILRTMSRPQIRVLLIQVNIRSLRPTCSISRLAQRFLSTSTRRLAPPTATSLKNETGDNVKLGALGTTASGKKLNIRTYPRYDDLEDERLYRKQHLAAAFRIFAERGFDEGVAGHISELLTSCEPTGWN